MKRTFSSPKSPKTVVLYEDFSKFRAIGFLKWQGKKIVLWCKRNKEFFKCAAVMLIVYILTVIALCACNVL